MLGWTVRQSLHKKRDFLTTHLDGALLQNHTTSEQDLLVGTSDVKVPAAGVDHEVGYVAAMQGHGHHGEFLDGFAIWLSGRVGNIVVYMLEMVCSGIRID